MKNIIKTMWLRFLLWIEYTVGLYEYTGRYIRAVGERDLITLSNELQFLTELAVRTELRKSYLKKIMQVRTTAGIIQTVKLLVKEDGVVLLTSDPEKLKDMIEDILEIEISEEETGYRHKNQTGQLWIINCDKPNKRRLELFSIVVKEALKRGM